MIQYDQKAESTLDRNFKSAYKELETLKECAEYYGLDKTEQFEDFKRKYLDAVEDVERNQPKTLDFSGGNGIIKERSSGKGDRSAGHYAEKIGTIDFNDKNAVTKSLVEFETKYMESDIEHCRVITPSGDVFEVHGDRYTVDTSILGDKLKGSINEHNHVIGESQYSFSWEDLASSVSDGSKMSLAYDERYRYWMIMPDYPISESQLYEAYQNAITSVGDDLIFSPEKIPEGDEQHERIKRACEELGIRYQRVLIADRIYRKGKAAG